MIFAHRLKFKESEIESDLPDYKAYDFGLPPHASLPKMTTYFLRTVTALPGHRVPSGLSL